MFKEKVGLYKIQSERRAHTTSPITLPHSLDFRVSLRIDHEAPVDVLLNGVEPPELPGHDDEDGRDIDKHQALVWEVWDEVTHDDSVQNVQSDTHQYKHQAYTCPLRQPVIHDPGWTWGRSV